MGLRRTATGAGFFAFAPTIDFHSYYRTILFLPVFLDVSRRKSTVARAGIDDESAAASAVRPGLIGILVTGR